MTKYAWSDITEHVWTKWEIEIWKQLNTHPWDWMNVKAMKQHEGCRINMTQTERTWMKGVFWGLFLHPFILLFPNSFSYRGSYFKLGGEGSRILWIRCGGGCHTGSRWRCRLVCVGVTVRLSHMQGVVEVSSGVCRVRVRRSKTGLSSHRVSLEVQSSDVYRGQGFAV